MFFKTPSRVMKTSRKIENPLTVLSVFAALIFLFLVFRGIGLYPVVFGDEYAYSKLSRLLPLSESSVPGYVYLQLYRITNYCGDGFLGCARLINAVLFVAATPFIYLVGKSVANSGASLVASLLAVAGPISSYTAYFMPESFYFFCFWVFCWQLLKLDSESENYGWFGAGAIYATSALIKPHSILFLPAILIYIAFVFCRGRGLFCRKSAIAFASFILGALLIKFGVSYFLAGPAGLTIFGSLYGSMASSTRIDIVQLFQVAFESIKGHILVVALIYGLPLSVAITIVINVLSGKSTPHLQENTRAARFERVAVLSLIILLNLFCVVALFTASVANSGPYETPYRLHMRYYNFALPLFYIVAAGASFETIEANRNVRYCVGVMVAILGVGAIWTNLAPYTPNYVDSPEIRGLHLDLSYFHVIGSLFIVAIGLWLFSRRKGIQFYLYVVLPFFVCVSAYHVWLELDGRLKQDVYDKAGIFVKQYLTSEDLSRTVVMGSEAVGLFKSLYYIDNAKASSEILERDADLDLSKLPPDKDWVLVVGDHDLVGNPKYQIPMNGFNLVRTSKGNVIDFKRGAWPGIVLKVKGLSFAESWGTWSQSDDVVFEFVAPLPSQFEIHLVANAFGPNVDAEFEASVGDSIAKFRLSANREMKIIKLENPKGSRVIGIKIPNAISPRALGVSGDERNLGIGFVEMRIVSSK